MTGTHNSQPTIFTGNIASPNIGKYSMKNGGESLDVKISNDGALPRKRCNLNLLCYYSIKHTVGRVV